MAGASREVNGVPLDAEGAQHRADGDAEPFEYGTLLDMHLQVRLDVREAAARFKGTVEIDAARGQRIRQGDALAILEPAYGVGVERAGHSAGAKEAAAEAGPLLIGPVDQAEGRGRGRLRVQAQHLQRRRNAEAAVQPAAVGHGVDVGANHDDVGHLAGEGRPQVAGLVDLDHAWQFGELGAQPVARLLPLGRPAEAPRAIRAAGQRRQLAQVAYDAVGADLSGSRRCRRMRYAPTCIAHWYPSAISRRPSGRSCSLTVHSLTCHSAGELRNDL